MPLKPELVLRLLRFAVVGGMVMIFFMGLNWLFGRWMGATLAFLLAYPPALALHYLLNKWWTFGDRMATDGRKVAEYLHTVVVTFLIQWPVFMLARHALGMPPWLAAGVANMAQMFASFLLMQWRVFRPVAERPGEVSGSAAWHRLGCLLLGLAVSTLLLWTALGKWEFPRVGPRQGDYYNLLVHGFEKGSLALDLPVPTALKEIEVPWDPAQRPAGLGVPADVSYADGRYYLYFGVTPAVILFWPFRALTGADLPFAYGLCVFAIGAYWVLAALWLRIVRDQFPTAGLLTKLGGGALLGLAGGLLILTRRANFWELPIAAGQFCLAVMVTCAYRALFTTRPAGWIAGAGTALGLAVGSRPTLAVAGAGLAVLVLQLGARRWREVGWEEAVRTLGRMGLAGGLPLALIMAALMGYNHWRFGSPFEFGLNYQLTSVYEAKAQHFSFSYVPFNAGVYFWQAPVVERYFPFLHPPVYPPAPARYYSAEYVFGALWVCPALWLLLAWLRRGAAGRTVAPFARVVAAIAVTTTGILLCFNTAVSRYTADFLPWWLLLALLGYARFGATRPVRSWHRLAFAAAVVVSVIAAFLASSGLHGMLQARNPGGFSALARVANAPVGYLDILRGTPMGPVEIEATFPGGPRSGHEPLLVAGRTPEHSAVFWVEYLPGDLMRFTYESSGAVPLQSEPVPREADRPYRLRLESGALYPPREHPLFAGRSELEMAWVKGWVRLELDGQVLIDALGASVDVSPGTVRAGVDVRAFRDQTFSGTISRVARQGVPARLTADGPGGDIRLEVNLPAEDWGPPFATPSAEAGQPQPLVSAGRPGNADVLAVGLQEEGSFRFRYESWGAGLWESPVWPVPPGRRAVFRVRLGSILTLPAESPLAVLRSTVAVWQDGRAVWWQKSGRALAEPVTVHLARNAVESTSAVESFRGRVAAASRLPAPPAWRPGPTAWIRLSVAGGVVDAEPLVATGPAGAANTLAIQRRAEGRARLVYDHWGHGAYESEEFAFGEGAHEFDVTLPSLTRLDGGKGEGATPGRLRVKLDGRTVWETEVPYYMAASDTVCIARNRAGASVAASEYRGVVLEIIQGPAREDDVP